MSTSHLSYEPDPQDRLSLTDEAGRSLECYVENSLEVDNITYLLLMPVDSPVIIFSWGEENKGDFAEVVPLEGEEEIEEVFADAKAVLAELNLFLKHTAFTLTVAGEIPSWEEEEIMELEVESDDDDVATEQLQFLASCYRKGQKYSIFATIEPLLFFAKYNIMDKLELISPDDDNLRQIMEELLVEKLE